MNNFVDTTAMFEPEVVYQWVLKYSIVLLYTSVNCKARWDWQEEHMCDKNRFLDT